MILLLAFILVPIIEIALLIKVGGIIGLWPTLMIVIATAMIGSWLLRSQGWGVLNRAQESLAAGSFPARELFEGLCLVVAGVLLLTPGFATDALGLVLFVPGLRLILAQALWQMLLRTDSVRFQFRGGAMDRHPQPHEADDKTIEGEYRNIDDTRRPGDENDR